MILEFSKGCVGFPQNPITNFPRTFRKSITTLTNLKILSLFQCWTTQKDMRIAVGKSNWFNYNPYTTTPKIYEKINLREILNDEIVIEFDTDDKNKAYEGINFTGINLWNAGIKFEVWDHGGKSPHLHIRNLPINHLSKDELRLFKKIFIRKYVPLEYLDCVDYSLTGIHLVALEWTNHWKGKYGIKELLCVFNPQEDFQ